MFIAAAVIGGVAAVGGAVLAGNASKSAAKSAAKAQGEASDKQIALQREQMKYAQTAMQPYRDAGTGADRMLDARWNVGPMAASIAAYNAAPGGQFAPSVYRSTTPSGVYTPTAAAAYGSYGSGEGRVPRAGMVQRPQAPQPQAPAPEQAPWWQSVNYQMPQPQAPVVQQPAPNPGGSTGQNNQSALAAYLGGLGRLESFSNLYERLAL